MSNEELVQAIQAGHTELIPQLWDNVEKLIAWRANRFLAAISATGLCHGVETGDLVNSGFFALLAAVKTYDPEKCLFSTWLLFYLKSIFAETTGYRTEKQRSDPLHYALSMDAPLEDAEGDTLGDLQEDPASAIPFENVENQILRGQLHNALENVIGDLPDMQAEVIRYHYWDQMTLEEIGRIVGKSTERIRQLEENAIRALRTVQNSRYLENFVDRHTPYYLFVGSQEFRRTHISATEKIILIRERLRKERKMKV